MPGEISAHCSDAIRQRSSDGIFVRPAPEASERGRLTLAVVGVDDLVVVATRDAVLVVPREQSQETKALVDKLKDRGHPKHLVHPQVHPSVGVI